MEPARRAGKLSPPRKSGVPGPAAPGRSTDIVIRSFDSIGDHERCAELQGRIWGAPNAVAASMIVAVQRHGGIAIGAFDRQGRLLGFVFSFLAPTSLPGAARGLSHHSHMAGVAPEWQNRGLGTALKLAQREAVLAQGLNLVTWTYDPLEARNATLNLHKLGAICCTYHRDYYGEMRDTLNAGVASDRFEVEWWLDKPSTFNPQPSTRLEVDIPGDFQSMKRADINLARAWRMRTRLQFEDAFARGFVACDFTLARNRAFYILARPTGWTSALAPRTP